jgi:hypothetical protein
MAGGTGSAIDDPARGGRMFRAALAADPQAAGAWRRLAERALATGEDHEALSRLQRAGAAAGDPYAFELLPLAQAPAATDCRVQPADIVLDDGAVRIAPYCIAVAGAVVTSDFLVILPSGELLVDGLVPDPAAPTQLTSEIEAIGPRQAIARIGPERAVGRAILLGGSLNYYHWLIDYLPRLALVDPHDDRWFIVNDRPSALQRSMLAAVGIDDARLLPVTPGQRLRVENLLLPSLLTRSSLMHPAALEWLRRRFRHEPQGSEPVRFFISRSKAAKRRLCDEDAAIADLATAGFAVVHPELLPFQRQAALFAGAKVIVAPHGAGLSNLVFASPGCTVVEIDVEGSRRSFYSVIAAMVGARHHRVRGQPISPGALQDSDIILGEEGRERLRALIGAIDGG